MTQPLTTPDLEELLDESIPCGGIRDRDCARGCTAEAVLQWTNPHGCPEPAVAHFKCVDCWMVLYQHLAHIFAKHGRIRCRYCRHISASVLAHTDFRPF